VKALSKHLDGFITRFVSRKSAFVIYVLLIPVKIRSALRILRVDY
jgi:hypothetical protein